MLNIRIQLPDDRRQPGTLELLPDMAGTRSAPSLSEEMRPSAAGAAPIASFPCLGKADGERATEAGNHDRDPTLPYGDTPTGDYAPTGVKRLDPPHPHMGARAIPLSGASGQALQARIQGREALFIHGGRGDERLVPTFGCVRLLDRDMAKLAELIGDRTVEISIFSQKERSP